MGESELKNKINVLNKKIDALKDELEELKKNPKVNARKIKVIGSQLTRLNYTAGNHLVLLDKLSSESDPDERERILRLL